MITLNYLQDVSNKLSGNLVSEQAVKHLYGSLRGLENGHAPTPPFKLYGKDDWSIVTEFLASVDRKGLIPKWLLKYELSRKEKFGLQGGFKPWSELRENARMYYDRNSSCNLNCYTNTLEKYHSLKCKMKTPEETLNALKSDDQIQSRAAGWNDFNLKKTDKIAQDHALHLCKTGQWAKAFAYYYSRYSKLKPRLFVPMSYSSMILQAQAFQPFLRAIQDDLLRHLSNSKFVFWADKIGFKRMWEDIILPRIADLDIRHLVFVMRDFDKMDTSTGLDQKVKLFLPKLRAAVSNMTPIVEDAILFSNKIPIITPEGLWEGLHGEASGATVTNGGETCCNEEFNECMQEYIRNNADVEYREVISLGNGDDGLSIYELKRIDDFPRFAKYIKLGAKYASKLTNFIIQADKWDIFIGEYGKYCQNLIGQWNHKWIFCYPASLILNSIMHPEKQYSPSNWDKDYRDLDVCEKLDNGYGLPYFHELIDYVDSGMKYHLLGRSEETTRRILSKYERYRALQGNYSRYNQNDLTQWDITTSPTIKYLLSKRI